MRVESIPLQDIKVIENVRLEKTSDDSTIKELMMSIKQHGLKEPIGIGKTKKKDEYILIYGSRRLLAYKKLGFKTIPAIIEDEPSLSELLITNAIENLQRKDVTPYELGRICDRLLKLDLSAGEISARLGIVQTKVNTALIVYKELPKELRDKVTFMGAGKPARKGNIPASVAYRIYRVKRTQQLSKSVTLQLMELARKEELGIRDIEVIALLLDKGLSVSRAMAKKREYIPVRVDILVNKKELLSRTTVKEEGKNIKLSAKEVTAQIMFGKTKPLSDMFLDE